MFKRWADLPRAIQWLVGIAVVVLALVIVWALFVPLADWLADHDVGSATGSLHETALDNARGRLLTLGAGLLAAAALAFTALNFGLLRRTSEKTDQWQRRAHELTEQGQMTDRYTKAIEQLGSDKLDVRIGGIYALERVARDSARDQSTVMEVLSAFVREHSREQRPPLGPDITETERSTRPDVQTAVTVVGRRDQERDFLSIDLTRAVLHGANLRGAHLDGARFCGADLTGAHLDGAFLARADLSGAHLARAESARRGPHSRGPLPRGPLGADLSGADLRAAQLGAARLDDASLHDADLSGADLGGAHLNSADLTGASGPKARGFRQAGN